MRGTVARAVAGLARAWPEVRVVAEPPPPPPRPWTVREGGAAVVGLAPGGAVILSVSEPERVGRAAARLLGGAGDDPVEDALLELANVLAAGIARALEDQGSPPVTPTAPAWLEGWGEEIPVPEPVADACTLQVEAGGSGAGAAQVEVYLCWTAPWP